MRPIEKWTVGHKTPNGSTVVASYTPHGTANGLLYENLDKYCNYCEIFSELEIEHVIAQIQDATLRIQWTNFLLSCGRCNGADNKGAKMVDFSQMYFPHLNNTLLVFQYGEGGLVKIHPNLTTQNQQDKATALLDLLCLDKYSGNPKYPSTPQLIQGFLPTDRRWEHRRRAWEKAQRRLAEYEKHEIAAEKVVEFARERGFFSIWFTVFAAHRAVREALVNTFKGTARNCFDADYNPIPRNPTNTIDPI